MVDNNDKDLEAVEHWISSLRTPEVLAIDLVELRNSIDGDDPLADVCEQLHDQLQRLMDHHAALLSHHPPLFSNLYVKGMDAETVWGQVAQMNLKSKRLVVKTIREIEPSSQIQLLAVDDDDDDDGDENEFKEKRPAVSSDDEGSKDDERKRIQARMDKALEDMQHEESDDDCSSAEPQNETASLVDPKEFEIDKDAVSLHDGFFNLQEMEAFADEEEGFLPDEAFGTEEVEAKDDQSDDRRTFHQKQRDGDMDVDEDDDEDPLTVRTEPSVRRKNYRKDEDIQALHELYVDDAYGRQVVDEEDAIHMTAADLFGKPNQKYYERWKSKSSDFNDNTWDSYGEKQAPSRNDETTWADVDIENDDTLKADDNDFEDEETVPMKEANKPMTNPKPYNKQTEKLIAQTEQLEKELLAEKPWQMKGETVSSARPINSLLQTTPEFEVASKAAPEINIAFTENLEEAIKKRILEENWDDVVPRELPDVGWHSKRGEAPEVSQEKSKLSLGEIYEREYLKKMAGYDVEAAEKETEEQKAKGEMQSLFANLCSKLDALSNYHFTPRPLAAEPEARPITQPAIAMEEVLPLHFNSERASAPEEVYRAKRGRDGILRAESELDQVDRKRLRRAKKAARRKARKSKLADEKLVSRLQPGNGLENPYEKRRMREELAMARSSGKVTTGAIDDNKYGDSTTFFKRMQQEAKASIASKSKNTGEPADKGQGESSSAFKM